MQPRIKMGLTVGAIGLALNICIAGFMGICGPLVSLFAGGAAGFFAAQQEKLPTKNDGAKAGAIAGGMAIYYASGIGTGLCFGIFGALLAAGTGAGTGYMATPDQPTIIPPM